MTIEDLYFVLLGMVVAYVLMRYVLNARYEAARRRSEDMLAMAKRESDLLIRERQGELDAAQERREAELKQEWLTRKQELEHWEQKLDKQAREVRLERGSLKRREMELIERRQTLEQFQSEYRKRLEAIASMSKIEAMDALKEELRSECAKEISVLRDEMLGKAEEEINDDARRIMVDAIQRLGNSVSSEISATLVKLPNEEMKGRIIGREGRNIHSFEAATGTTLMIDETPESVMVSCFDPVRREIARIALEELVRDGRIHPGTIEEAVEKAEEAIHENVVKLGEEAVNSLKIRGLDNEVLSLLGKLHFYLSNNQRTLEHSVETAYLCSIMASELGLNPEIAKRAGLFHDIGKAISHEFEGSHARAGALFIQSHGELPVVVNAVEAHHDEVPMSSPYAVLVQVADSLSSTRPGARNESMDGYIQRIDNLETLAMSFTGVRDAYAIRAGRELRVIVAPDQVSDAQAASLALKIRQRVEQEYTYPGTIRVTVVREQRFTETAT